MSIMSNGSRYPRNSVVSPFEGYPAYGAVHEVMPDHRFREFMSVFARISDQVFDFVPPVEVIDPQPDFQAEAGMEAFSLLPEIDEVVVPYDSRKFYKIFDPDKMGATVLEMDPAQKAAKRIRKVFESQDFGAVEKNAKNEIDRIMPMSYPELVFNRVESVGNLLPGVSQDIVRQKLALFSDTTKCLQTHKSMQSEQTIIVKHLKKHFKQFMTPWTLVPHLTFAVFRKQASAEQVTDIIGKTNEYVQANPLYVSLERSLTFRSRSDR